MENGQGYNAEVIKAKLHFKMSEKALAGVVQWIERHSANQRVAGSIPSQGTCLGCGPLVGSV